MAPGQYFGHIARYKEQLKFCSHEQALNLETYRRVNFDRLECVSNTQLIPALNTALLHEAIILAQ